MIAASLTADQPQVLTTRNGWQQSLADAFTDPHELLRELQLDPSLIAGSRLATAGFPMRVPRGFAARMRKGDVEDPLLLQVLPLGAELDVMPQFTLDPVQDLSHRSAPGLLQKYRGRALLVATGACAVHCRYCFRRHYPYSEESAGGSHWQLALEQLRADPGIREIILSGGDPLSLADHKFERVLADLTTVPHISRLRIHTRYPVVLPERIDDRLLRALAGAPWPVVMVVHSNHPNELDAQVAAVCAELKQRGVTLLNQAVLLARVNDSADALVSLSERLFEIGVLPYYLHLLDRVQGAAHFEVSEDRARGLMREILARLPGYLVPRLVREISGDPSKTPVPL